MPEIFDESLALEPVGQRLLVDRVVYDGHTGMQAVQVLDTPAYGRVLVLDGIIQTSERDEFIYHEMIAHVPLVARALAAGDARRVLIVGGGDGGALEEVLKHPVERVTMVEIDAAVVALCRRYLPSICGAAFDDPRSELVIADGARYVAEARERFDVILLDSTDPLGASEVLFGEAFYRNCRALLAPGGVIVTQAGVPFTAGQAVRQAMRRLAAAFGGASGAVRLGERGRGRSHPGRGRVARPRRGARARHALLQPGGAPGRLRLAAVLGRAFLGYVHGKSVGVGSLA
jgi:spermidine synthase